MRISCGDKFSIEEAYLKAWNKVHEYLPLLNNICRERN